MPSIDGVVSGLDTTSLINAIVTSRSVSIANLENRKTDYDQQREGVAGVKNRMQSLVDAIGELDEAKELSKWKVDSTAKGYTMSAIDGTATAGTYAVKVEQLASAQTTTGQGFDVAPTDHVLGHGTLAVTVGGTTTNVTIDGTNDTWEGLASSLSQIDGLSSYVIDTGAPTDRYRLMLQGMDTGVDGAFSLDTSGLSGGTIPTFSNTTTAVDARVVIGGVTIHSASNTLSGAIPGVRIELKEVTAAAENATVSRDTEATKEAFQKVLDAYNAVIDWHAQQSTFDLEKDIRGPLVGESTTRRAIDGMSFAMSGSYTVPGVDLKSLGMLGVETGRDGKLTLDDTAFTEAFEADSDAVVDFLTHTDGPLRAVATRLEEMYLDSENGSLVVKGEGLDSTIEDLDEQIGQAEERLTSETERLRAQFTAMEVILSQLTSTQGYLSALFTTSTTST